MFTKMVSAIGCGFRLPLSYYFYLVMFCSGECRNYDLHIVGWLVFISFVLRSRNIFSVVEFHIQDVLCVCVCGVYSDYHMLLYITCIYACYFVILFCYYRIMFLFILVTHLEVSIRAKFCSKELNAIMAWALK